MKILKLIGTLLLIGLLFILGYAIFRKNHFIAKDEAIETYQFENSQFIEWNDLNIHLLEKGQEHNKSVFLIHGLGGALHEFNPLGDVLAKEYHVVSFDLPGFGLSDAPQESVDVQDFYSNFMQFILDRYGRDTSYIIGNSMGGLITWNTALDYPEKVNKMVLLAAAGYDMKNIAEENAEWINKPSIKFLLAKGAAPFIAKSNVELCFYDHEKIPDYFYERKYGMMNKEGNLTWLKQLAEHKDFTDTSYIQTIQTPTLIIWGDKDEIIPLNHAYRFERDLPNNKLLVYKNCGHAPMVELKDRCAADILTFFKTKIK